MADSHPTARRPGKIDSDVFKQLVAAGATRRQLCERFNVTREAVRQRGAALGLLDALNANRAQRELKFRTPEQEARRAFQYQRKSADRRGIGWQLSFEQWWRIWSESGKWEVRGKTKGCYVMARPGDKGPYAVGNVYITTHSDNAKTAQSHANRPKPQPRKEPSGNGWIVRFRKEYHGYFRTAAEADGKIAAMMG